VGKKDRRPSNPRSPCQIIPVCGSLCPIFSASKIGPSEIAVGENLMSALFRKGDRNHDQATSPPTKSQPKTETVEQFLARGGKVQTIVGYPDSDGRLVPRTDAPNASKAAQIPLRYP